MRARLRGPTFEGIRVGMRGRCGRLPYSRRNLAPPREVILYCTVEVISLATRGTIDGRRKRATGPRLGLYGA